MNLSIPSLAHRLKGAAIVLLAPIAVLVTVLLGAYPVHAQPVNSLPTMASHAPLHSRVFGSMANKLDARAKQTEGKLESAYGEITGDTGRQIKGKAKQVQGSAKYVAEDMKEGAQSVGKKIAAATN